MSEEWDPAEMVLRCAARQDVEAPSLSAVDEATSLQPRHNPDEQAWIASRAALQERLSEPEVVAADVVAPALP